jgi:hypothetical protein
MNILFVTGHPAQIHNFRVLKDELEKKGNKVFWFASDKDISKYLLDYYFIGHETLVKSGNSLSSKIAALFKNTFLIINCLRKNNINIAVSRVSPFVSLACFFSGTTHIALTDTETAGVYDFLFGKFVSALLTAKSFKKKLRSDQIRFDGNIELFYLHPNRFKPLHKNEVADLLGINENDSYIIMRFVSWDAYHDKGLSGFSDENKLKAVRKFSEYAKVFISSEKELIKELDTYRIKIPFEKMHDVLAHALLFFGESATMASESAVLGTPAVFLNRNWFGSTGEEEKYGLLFSFKDNLEEQNRAILKGLELLENPQLKYDMIEKRNQFLKDKIDVTAFFVWFIENYPESAKIMRENPEYQYEFK